MRLFLLLALTLQVFAVIAVAPAQPSVKAKEPPSERAVASWIEQLGDRRFAVRESAQRALIAAGPLAMAEILTATKSEDREIKQRAEVIAVQIEANAATVLERFGAKVERRADGSVSEVDFGQDGVSKSTDADLVHLLALPKLERLFLWYSKVSDDGLKHVGRLTSLRELWLSRTKVSDVGLAHLTALDRLDYLSLEETLVRGPGLVNLKRMTRLRGLYLNGSQITDDGLKGGVTGLKDVENLNISLADTSVSDKGLAHLGTLKGLTRLGLIKTQVRSPGLAHLKALPCLEELLLRGTRIRDDGCAHLAAMKGLQVLGLEDTKVTMAGLQQLKNLHKLKQLYNAGLKLTETQRHELRRAMPSVVLD